VEYADHESDSIFVKFKITESPNKDISVDDNTILNLDHYALDTHSNVAVAVHPDFDYLFSPDKDW